MADLAQRFNAALEDRIWSTLQTEKMRRFHPNESVFIEPAIWTPSIHSVATNMSLQALGSTSQSRTRLGHQSDPIDTVQTLQADPAVSIGNYDAIRKLRSPSVPISPGLMSQTAVWSDVPALSSSLQLSAVSPQHSPAHTISASCALPTPITQPEKPLCKQVSSGIQGSMIEPISEKFDTTPAKSYSFVLSSSSCCSVNGSMPALMRYTDNVLRTYEPLIQGDTIQRRLTVAAPPIMLCTRHIHVTLSLDWLETSQRGPPRSSTCESKEPMGPERHCWVTVKWLSHGEQPKKSGDGGRNIVDLDNIGGNLEDTLSYGAAISLTALYVAHKVDVLGIKYDMGAASSVPKDTMNDFSI